MEREEKKSIMKKLLKKLEKKNEMKKFKEKLVRTSMLTDDCFQIQFFGNSHCKGCGLLGTKDCNGQHIRRKILSGLFPKTGLPSVEEMRKLDDELFKALELMVKNAKDDPLARSELVNKLFLKGENMGKERMEMTGKLEVVFIEMGDRTIKVCAREDYIGLYQKGRLICTLLLRGGGLCVDIYHHRNGVPDVQRILVEDDRG